MGFSPWGLAVSVAVLAPNLLLVWLPPRQPLPRVSVPWPIGVAERAGQALCLVVPAVTEPGATRWGWSAVVAASVVAYWMLWGRYLATGRRAHALYAPVWRVPVPMALLPVAAFLATGLWLDDLWAVGAALVLAAGHIPVSALTARAWDRA